MLHHAIRWNSDATRFTSATVSFAEVCQHYLFIFKPKNLINGCN
ncbi:hypothetical protein JCM19233_4262 [Vibrio astriarenae]|nr:hypothetical protein JCM19233_4262 [Vibrio sp. C7]